MRRLFAISELSLGQRVWWVVVSLLFFTFFWFPAYELLGFREDFSEPKGKGGAALKALIPVTLALLCLSGTAGWFMQRAAIHGWRRFVKRAESHYGRSITLGFLLSPRRLWGSKACRRTVIALAGTGLALLLFVPLPLAVNARDKQAAVSHAITAVLRDRRVLTEKGFDTGKGYRHLEETSSVRGRQLFFSNDLGIPDAVFLKHGLKPIPKDRKFHTGDGVVLIAFSNRDIQGKPTEFIQFVYVFGPLGAHGYEIKIYKSLITRYFVYAHQWIS